MKTLAHWTLIYKAIREVEELSRYGVSSNGFKLENRGICSSVTETLVALSESAAAEDVNIAWDACEEFLAWMESVLPLWPSFSGNLDYPIEGFCEEYSYHQKWTGKHSKKRKELLAWLIEKLEDMPAE